MDHSKRNLWNSNIDSRSLGECLMKPSHVQLGRLCECGESGCGSVTLGGRVTSERARVISAQKATPTILVA